ncbi:MAG: hypothetical protein QXI19_12640 [Candidatus Caldarchaeum sp.]
MGKARGVSSEKSRRVKVSRIKLNDLSLLEDPVKVEERANEWVANLGKARKSVKIFAGEAPYTVFDRPKVIRALQEAAKRGVNIEIVVGPVISRGGNKESPELLELASRGTVKLYYRPRRESGVRFMILNDEEVVEWLHDEAVTLLQEKPSCKRYSRVDRPQDFALRMNKFKLHASGESLTLHPEKQFLLLRPAEIRKIFELASQQSKDYNNLGREEIEQLLRQVLEREKKIRAKFDKELRRYKQVRGVS